MKLTEGKPLVWRWAKALYHVAEHIEVHIDDHQLLAGRIGRSPRYSIMYPEIEGDFYASALGAPCLPRDLPGGDPSPGSGDRHQGDRPLLVGEEPTHEQFNKAPSQGGP